MDLEATLQWSALTTTLAASYGINPAIVLAIIYMESLGDPTVVNPRSQATGLMQVMPAEAGEMFSDRPSSQELKDPLTNINWGLRILYGYMKASGETTWTAVYRYSGGEHWESEAKFTTDYYLPFCEAWATIEHALAAEEPDGGLRVRGRYND